MPEDHIEEFGVSLCPVPISSEYAELARADIAQMCMCESAPPLWDDLQVAHDHIAQHRLVEPSRSLELKVGDTTLYWPLLKQSLKSLFLFLFGNCLIEHA